MKKGVLVAAVMGAGLLLAQVALAAAPVNLQTEQDKLSYTVGADMGKNFRRMAVSIDPSLVAKGLTDGLKGDKMLLTDQEMQTTLSNFQKSMLAKRKVEFKELASKNAKAGQAFLAGNKSKSGVVTLSNGLQYKVLTPGAGKLKPVLKDVVKVDYEVTTIDGNVIDSSYKRGKPVSFPVSGVIPAWTKALQLMRPGATWMVYAPSDLAYGEHGIGEIGPNQTLVFKIHLISIKDKVAGTSKG